jgi:hypothetical protein
MSKFLMSSFFYCMVLCVAGLPSEAKPSHSAAFRLDSLKLNEVSNGCGNFFGKCEPPSDKIEYILATASDGINMVIRVNGVLHTLKEMRVIYYLSPKKQIPPRATSLKSKEEDQGSKVGDPFVGNFSDGLVTVRFTCVIDEILGEGASFNGTMSVTFRKTTQVIKICGAGGC